MARFKRLTDTEARTLTRAQLLDRLEAESAYWDRRPPKSDEDREAYREFSAILHAYLNPADGLRAARDVLEGRGSDYWESRPVESRPRLRETGEPS